MIWVLVIVICAVYWGFMSAFWTYLDWKERVDFENLLTYDSLVRANKDPRDGSYRDNGVRSWLHYHKVTGFWRFPTAAEQEAQEKKRKLKVIKHYANRP